MSWRDFPSFFSTQNHFDRYAELDLSYTPTRIFSFKILTTSSYIPGGMGMLCSTHGICSMVGMTTRSKYPSGSFHIQMHPTLCLLQLERGPTFLLPATRNWMH